MDLPPTEHEQVLEQVTEDIVSESQREQREIAAMLRTIADRLDAVAIKLNRHPSLSEAMVRAREHSGDGP